MIKKAHKNWLALGVLAGVLLNGWTPCFGSPMPLFQQGFMIQATPFDHKVIRTGLFTQNFQATSSALAADSLFSVARSFRYVPDKPGKDTWQTPDETDMRRAGDCEDKAVWLYAQLKKNGYSNVRLVIGRMRASSRGFHVWVSLTNSQGQYLILDPTAQKKIWEHSSFSDGEYTPLYSFDGVTRYRHDS
jgi:hypothetical protein